MNVHIYYGGLSGFRTMIKDIDDYMPLVDLVLKDDAKHRDIKLDVEGNRIRKDEDLESYQCVIAFSEDYSSFTESFIESFINFLFRYRIDDLYLQNPPNSITKRIKQYSSIKCEVIERKYQTLGIEELKKLKEGFPQTVIGQGRAQNQILSALYNVAKGRYNKPCVLLFYGSTGIGKTETAKFIADTLEEKLFRKQFSMLHSEAFSSYIFGGKHNENSFARELLERESNVVLLDEFDKPHPVFHSAFYQLFDEGIYEDKNYIVSMGSSIIICTSNFMSEKEIKAALGEPIYSRFDAVIKFDKLDRNAIGTIIRKEYNKQFEELDEDEKKVIEQSEIKDAIFGLVDRLDNARQIRRVIREAMSTILINKMVE